MDENEEQEIIADAIRKRIAATPDDYYIADNGHTLYALLGGYYMWSMPAPTGDNFHKMTETKIAMLIHDHLQKKLG